MSTYFALMKARFLTLLQYREAALAGIMTQIAFGLIRVMIIRAFYASAATPPETSLAQVVTMIWLGQAVLGIIPWNGDGEIMSMMRSGNVAYELARPIHLYTYWYVRALALRTAPTLLRAVPQFLIALFLFPPEWRMVPGSWLSVLAWTPTLLGAILLSAALTTLMSIASMWTLAADGILRITTPIVTLLSGMIVPLLYYPDWAKRALELLPFAGVYELPARVFSGVLEPSAAFGVFALQLFWTAALVLLGRLITARGLGRIVVQGG